jgi:hypothetical protein
MSIVAIACLSFSAAADNPDSLLWSTFLGGEHEEINQDIVTDSNGDVYVCGTTQSQDFPATPGAFDTTYNGGTTNMYGGDVWVAKFDGETGALVWATYIGGPDDEEPDGLQVNASGEVIVYGCTASPNFPTTAGAYCTVHHGGYDLFLLKLSANGDSLIFSTFLGGSDYDDSWEENSPALDAAGNIYVTGITRSDDFPTTPGAYDTTFNGNSDAFVTKFAPDGSAVLYSTYLGGDGLDQGQDIKVNSAGEAYVTGVAGSSTFPVTVGAHQTVFGGGIRDAFVAKLNAAGSDLVYSTYIGGSGNDRATGIVLHASGDVFVCGDTDSLDYPVTPGAYCVTSTGAACFVSRLSADGSELVASTQFWGGWVAGLERDADGSVWVAGYTGATDLPTTPTAYSSSNRGGNDSFVAQFSDTLGNILYCSYIGGTNDEEDTRVATDSMGRIFLGGWTFSPDFPLTPGAADDTWGVDRGESFVLKINPTTIKVHYLTLFDSEMDPLYASFGQDYLNADLDADGLPDRFQAGLVAWVLSVGSHAYWPLVDDLYKQAIATLRTEPNYATELQPYEHILGALLTTSVDMVAELRTRLSLTGSYSVFTITKLIDEPFSAQGDIDGDGTTNLEEYQNILDQGYSPEESLENFLEAANDPFRDGRAVPAVFPRGLLVLAGAMVLFGLAYLRLRRTY